MSAVFAEHQQFLDSGGRPIVGGYVYFGKPNSDPVTDPITIYADRALTIPLANPQRTDVWGRTENKVWIDGRYSFKLTTNRDVQITLQHDNGESSNTSPPIALSSVIGGNTITAKSSPAITRYTDKQGYVFTAPQDNTGPVTLNINNLGALPIVTTDIGDSSLQEGDISERDVVLVIYNEKANHFQWMNPKAREIVGQIVMYGGKTAPNGWLFCDGANVSRADFSRLFLVIGETYGPGDGSTTFSLPDLRGRSPMGVGTGAGLTERTLGEQLGEEEHTLTINEMPSHDHNVFTGRGTRAPHLSAISTQSFDGVSSETTDNTGGSLAHNTIHPCLGLNFIIRT